jgi:hypothetical protein
MSFVMRTALESVTPLVLNFELGSAFVLFCETVLWVLNLDSK